MSADLPEVDTTWCDECEKEQVVVEDGSTPGFTGMPIFWANLACGHQLIDASEDNIEAVR